MISGKIREKIRDAISEGGFTLLLWRLFMVTALLFISRIIFYLFNSGSFPPLDFWPATGLFLNGFRFDVATVLIINAPFILFHLLPLRGKSRKVPRRTMRWLFYIVNSFALGVNVADMVYFRFSSTRINSEIFSYLGTGGDFAHLLPSYIRDFWQVVLLGFVFIWLLIRFYYPTKALKHESRKDLKWRFHAAQLPWSLLLLVIFIMGARGGLQPKPINVVSAAKYAGAQYTPLIINSPFSIIKTLGRETINKEVYFESEEELLAGFNPIHLYSDRIADSLFRPENVVIIILEGFSAEYSAVLSPHLFPKGGSYMPFLDSLMGQSLNFTNAFANATRSIEAMPAITASIPHLMKMSFILSEFSANPIHSLPLELGKKGYVSQFFHGGTNGTMAFDKFAAKAGFNEYHGRTEYNNETDFDGHWGIYDGPFLQYAARVMNKNTQPFFATIFTLSSHHPYSIPKNKVELFAPGPLEVHRSIRYADYALWQFFKTASKMPWYENTLFVITADHTSESQYPEYQSRTGIFRVPLVFFKPDRNWGQIDTRSPAQHVDIMPSVLDYLNYNHDFLAFGLSLFEPAAQRKAFHLLDDIYQIIEQDYTLHFGDDMIIGLYRYHEDKMLINNLAKEEPELVLEMSHRLKAIIQTFNNRMHHNRLKIN